MSVRSMKPEFFSDFGSRVLLEDNLEFLSKYNYEEHISPKRGNTYCCVSRVYMEKLTGQAVMNVATENGGFCPFLFDSMLYLNEGIRFNFTPLTDDFSYCIYYQDEPLVVRGQHYDYRDFTPQIKCSHLVIFANKYFPDGVVFRPEVQPFWELTYIRKGNLVRTMGGREYPLSDQDCSFVPANMVHSLTSEREPQDFFVIMFDFDFPEPERLTRPIKANAKIKYYLDRIIEREKDTSAYAEESVLNLLNLIIIEYLSLRNEENALESGQNNPSAQMNRTANAAAQLINENIFNSELSVQFLAEKLFISTSYLYNCMMQCYGVSALRFIHTRRLEIARELIEKGNYSLIEIATNLNFCSQSYFSTQFRKEFGLSPQQYRRAFQENGPRALALLRRAEP